MKCLVTGATGLLGNNLIRRLLEKGHSVRALVREIHDHDSRPLRDIDVELHYGDIRDPDAVCAAGRNVDLIFHSAAIVRIGRRNQRLFEEVNVQGTKNTILSAKEGGARLVHISSADTVGLRTREDPSDENVPFDERIRVPYMRTKWAAEQAAKNAAAAGQDIVVVNPGFLLGPWDWKPSSGTMLLAVGNGLGWFAPPGYGSFVDVRDVTEATLSAALIGRSGEKYLLTGTTLSYFDAWCAFAEIVGRPRPLGTLHRKLTGIAGLMGDGAGYLAGKELPLNSGALGVSDLPRFYSNEKARKELSFSTRSFSETISGAWDWFVEYGYARARR